MNKMMTLVTLVAAMNSSIAQAMQCHIENDKIYGVWKVVTGVCDGGYRFKVRGPALGLKFEATDFFGITCTSSKKSGDYFGIGVDVGFAKGFTGAAFLSTASNPYTMSETKACFMGGLSDIALLYVGVSLPVLSIKDPTPQSIEEAKHFGLK